MQTSWLPSTLKEIRSVAKSKKLYNLGHREVYFHILPATESSFNGCPLVSTSLNVMETNIATSLHRMIKNLHFRSTTTTNTWHQIRNQANLWDGWLLVFTPLNVTERNKKERAMVLFRITYPLCVHVSPPLQGPQSGLLSPIQILRNSMGEHWWYSDSFGLQIECSSSTVGSKTQQASPAHSLSFSQKAPAKQTNQLKCDRSFLGQTAI